MQKLTKFIFKVRCKNGFIVNNLKINGLDFDHARARLEQMYPRCTLLNYQEIKDIGWPFATNNKYAIKCIAPNTSMKNFSIEDAVIESIDTLLKAP